MARHCKLFTALALVVSFVVTSFIRAGSRTRIYRKILRTTSVIVPDTSDNFSRFERAAFDAETGFRVPDGIA